MASSVSGQPRSIVSDGSLLKNLTLLAQPNFQPLLFRMQWHLFSTSIIRQLSKIAIARCRRTGSRYAPVRSGLRSNDAEVVAQVVPPSAFFGGRPEGFLCFY